MPLSPSPVRGHDDWMVTLPGGMFLMGTSDRDANPGEGPVRPVTVAPFAIDSRAVSNERFAEFAEATGYKTEAERFGWSFVFADFLGHDAVLATGGAVGTPWWRAVTGATWRAPEGPGSGLDGRLDHPVTHVTWHDADAYA